MVVRQAGTSSVTCTNCQMAFTPDGGLIGAVSQGRALDGGTGWGVYIEGGSLSVSSSTTFDGGSIGYLRMPDGGALEVYTVNAGSSGGGWVPDGGFVGLVGLADGGGVFVTNTSIAVTGPLTDAQLRASAVPVSAASLPLPTGAATETTLSTRVADSTVTARLNTLGQKTGANSAPVVLASDQTAIPVTDNGGSLTVDGAVAATQSGTWNVTNISGTVSLPTGAATETTLGTRLADSTITGRFPTAASLADATANPSTTGTAVYLMGYNGTTWDRIRSSTSLGITVNISNTTLAVTQSGTWNVGLSAGTNYVGKFRLTDGTLDTSLLNSAPSSDTGQVALPVRIISSLAKRNLATPTTTTVSCTTTATAAPASARSSRVTATFYNAGTATVYLGGSAVTTATGIPLLPGASFTDDIESTPYYCLTASGTVDLRVLEN